MSNQTTLPGDLDLPAGQRPVAFELFVPVYGIELRPDATVAERRRWFVGWATGQFRAGDFLDAAMKTAPAATGVELHDEDVGGDTPVASHPAGFRATGPDVRQKRFTLGGRSFALRYAPLPGNPILAERAISAWLVLAIGVAASILLGGPAEEFAILLPDCALENAMEIADRCFADPASAAESAGSRVP